MRRFDDIGLKNRTWDNEVINYLSLIHEYKGKQSLYMQQKPSELERLVEIAKVQSTEASNSIEGIRTTETRLRQLMSERTVPRNRDEKEIVGYRDALNIIHENFDYIPLTPNYILQLHKILLSHTDSGFGGSFKMCRIISAPPMQMENASHCSRRWHHMKRRRPSRRFVMSIIAP